MSEMIDQVADALFEFDDDVNYSRCHEYAEVAIKAMRQPTRESILAAILKAGNCGIGDTGPDGKWRAIACNDESLKGDRHHYFEKCDCSNIADGIMALLETSS